VSVQLDGESNLSDLIQVDGEIGQPRLRHSCQQLYVMLDRNSHLLALFVLRGDQDAVAQQLGELNGSVESILSDTLAELEQLIESAKLEAEIDAFVLLPNVDKVAGQEFSESLPLDQTVFSSSISEFPENRVTGLDRLPEPAFDSFSGLLFPKRKWKRVELVRDEGRLVRQEKRVELENALLQSSWGLDAETTVIEGEPGSGKSLLLVSRVCWLASAMPAGSIILVTWNRSLASALKQWLATFDVATVEVTTMAEFLIRHDIELDLSDPADADARCREMLERRTFEPAYDAILIDEAQDLGGILIDLVERLLRLNRGGLTVVVDSTQNVRNRPPIAYSKLPVPLASIRLKHCYRCTGTIRRFSHAFAGYEIPPDMRVAEDLEELVRLVWAETVEDCTDMIVSEATRLMRDVGLRASEIMVVAFNGRQRRAISKAFNVVGLDTIAPGALSDCGTAVHIASPEVAKGHEASCVFLVGWDTIETNPDTAASRRFVAASRAADILFVVYTSQEHGSLANETDSLVVKQLWPDDFEVLQEG
jgi:hypothetical protein